LIFFLFPFCFLSLFLSPKKVSQPPEMLNKQETEDCPPRHLQPSAVIKPNQKKLQKAAAAAAAGCA
jgi:hypothetical protein